MTVNMIQLDLFARDFDESKKIDEENKKRASSKQVRFLFHKLTELEKKVQEKTP
jgi:hypothetical protein